MIVRANVSGGMIVRANLDAHEPDLDLRLCRRCGLTFEALERRADQRPCRSATNLSPSDLGLDGAIPLEPATWSIPSDHLLSDADWSAQNRKINALVSGRRRDGFGP